MPRKQETIQIRIQKAEELAYKRGVADGMQSRHKLINCMQTTNGYLWEELVRLDQEEPIDGVLIPFDFSDTIIRALRDYKRHTAQANKLMRIMREAQKKSKLHTLIAELEAMSKEEIEND